MIEASAPSRTPSDVAAIKCQGTTVGSPNRGPTTGRLSARPASYSASSIYVPCTVNGSPGTSIWLPNSSLQVTNS